MEELDAAKKSEKALVYYTAKWCGPCRMIAPVFDKLEEEHGGSISFAKVDIDEVPEAASKDGVMSVPTFVFLHNEDVVSRFSGANRDQLEASLESLAAK
eukprot:scaffold6939_cov143-Pinguiococcus_pyrenoidosus.AAC.1